MSRIRRNDPRRRHLHDYFLVEYPSGRDVAGFDSQVAALAYAVAHLRGAVTLLQVSHPEGCACQPGQFVYPDGAAERVPV